MSDFQKHFQTIAINHFKYLNGAINQVDKLLLDSLYKQLLKSGSSDLSDSEIELVINQLVNQAWFGPITSMELFLTENCNLACDYCFVREKFNNSISLETAFEAINFLIFYSGNQKNLNLTLFGGEPLLEKEKIYQIIDHCNKIEKESNSKKISISITTNGILIDELFLKRIDRRVNFLLSFDGDEETHDLYRKDKSGRGTFQKVVSKISLLKKYQGWLGARMTVTPETVQRLFTNVEFLFQSGINQFLIGLANDADWPEEALKNYKNQMRKVGQFYLDKRREKAPIRMTFFEKEKNELECSENVWGCGAGRNTISVTTKGDIYPCSKFVGYEEFDCQVLKLGTIYTGITDIELRNQMAKMNSESYEVCSSCDEINACRGGCPADNYFKNKNLYIPAPSACQLKQIGNSILRDMSVDLATL